MPADAADGEHEILAARRGDSMPVKGREVEDVVGVNDGADRWDPSNRLRRSPDQDACRVEHGGDPIRDECIVLPEEPVLGTVALDGIRDPDGRSVDHG